MPMTFIQHDVFNPLAKISKLSIKRTRHYYAHKCPLLSYEKINTL